RQCNFSWLTGGRGHIGFAGDISCAQILVTDSSVFLLANEIEAPRLVEEEIPPGLGIELRSLPWYSDGLLGETAADITGTASGKLLGDDKLENEIRELRTSLEPEEIGRYRELGISSAQALEGVCMSIKGGETEFELAGRVSESLWSRGIDPITLLVAADDRTLKFRHLVPTENRLKRYAILSICARKQGLIASATRLVHLGQPPKELLRKLENTLKVEAALFTETRPGAVYSAIFQEAAAQYAKAGVPEEWKRHHQGGLSGYVAREIRVTPDSNARVRENEAYAWNPTITGTKCEDTMLVLPAGNEFITHTGGYRYINVEYKGSVLSRPGIFVI
ncbi:MAG: M24 family metallopeptidase, partial [Spirochaetales bacterium]|nr:M24 family metallopeptidase [Spirochaetales bacterium]